MYISMKFCRGNPGDSSQEKTEKGGAGRKIKNSLAANNEQTV